jgi:8-amino-3,8-dideoxy-alpha-D-manno-octulosonate transaminase
LGSSDFSVSDALMSRCVSTGVSLAWTSEQIKEKGEKMAAAIRKVL